MGSKRSIRETIKDLSAEMAYVAISRYSDIAPTNTPNSLFRDLAGLFYEIAYPSSKDRLADLKRACAKVLKKYS